MCTKCVMDNSYVEIDFDDNGVCSSCHLYENYEKRNTSSEENIKLKFNKIIKELKEAGDGKEYDCIAGMSGGVDSSFLLHLLKENGIRVLAVQFDNGWNSELAVKNIENLCKKLDIDLYTYVVDWNEFRDMQLSFFKASVANLEAITDHGIYGTLYAAASRFGVKHIITGVNTATEISFVSISNGYNFWDLKQIRSIHKIYGKVKMKTFPAVGFWKRQFYMRVCGLKLIDILNYYPFNKDEAKKILIDKYDWKEYGGKHYESIITRFHQSYILLNKFGIDKRKMHLSSLIYSGQLTREDAIKELKNEPCSVNMIKEDKEYVIKKFQITEKDFELIMKEPVRSYKDYGNQEAFMNVYKKIIRAMSYVKKALFN